MLYYEYRGYTLCSCEELPYRHLAALPQEGEVLVSRALAETLKTQFRLSELDTDRAMLLVVFEGEYCFSLLLS